MITKWLDENTIEYVIACTYAHGKGYIFEMFYGWRKSKDGMSCIILSKRDWKIVEYMTEYYKKFCKNA